MNAKERFYSGLAKETIGKITSNTDNWTSFLRTMSRNYEFTYPEQVMIYAQRPNATFCKPYEDWNAENYRRYVKRGSTGIALFVMNRDKPYLRYVFDVADTGVRRSSPELKPWEVTPENRSYVMEAMERTFSMIRLKMQMVSRSVSSIKKKLPWHSRNSRQSRMRSEIGFGEIRTDEKPFPPSTTNFLTPPDLVSMMALISVSAA